jgi:hypothetical protein
VRVGMVYQRVNSLGCCQCWELIRMAVTGGKITSLSPQGLTIENFREIFLKKKFPRKFYYLISYWSGEAVSFMLFLISIYNQCQLNCMI